MFLKNNYMLRLKYCTTIQDSRCFHATCFQYWLWYVLLLRNVMVYYLLCIFEYHMILTWKIVLKLCAANYWTIFLHIVDKIDQSHSLFSEKLRVRNHNLATELHLSSKCLSSSKTVKAFYLHAEVLYFLMQIPAYCPWL